MTRHAFTERLEMAGLMAEVGPGAPTLCGDWTVRDLAAHLLLRERRPDAAPGILLKKLAGRTERVQRSIATGDFPKLLDELRHPPWWSPVSNPLFNEVANLIEMFVHHEDVRRAEPGWQPRDLSHGMQAALWKQVPTRAWLALRRFPVPVRLKAPGFGAVPGGRGGRGALQRGESAVTATGSPGELVVFLTGRQAHSQVALDGPPDVVARLRRARLGI